MPEILVAYSDCLDVATSHDYSVLFKCSNQYDYAGMEYTGLAIIQEIRIEGRHVKERFPGEDEDEETSDESVLGLSSDIKTQKLLEIEPTPHYFHQIIKLLLKHNKVEDENGETWSMGEAYEMEDLGDNNPFATAKIWLTKKEGEFFTNVFGEP